MKKGPLSEIEKFYIENNRGESVSVVAGKLNRSEKIVKEFLDTLPEPATVSEPTKLKVRSKTLAMMTPRTGNDNKMHGAIMTQAAADQKPVSVKKSVYGADVSKVYPD